MIFAKTNPHESLYMLSLNINHAEHILKNLSEVLKIGIR